MSETTIEDVVAEVKGMLQQQQEEAKAAGLNGLAILLTMLVPLLYLPDEYVEDVWMINSLLGRLRKMQGTAKIPKPYFFDKFEVVNTGYNGKEFVFQVLATTKIPHPNMVVIYGDVSNPGKIIFSDSKDEESLTVKLDKVPGQVWFDWYVDKNALRTLAAQQWEELDEAIRNGNPWDALKKLWSGITLLKGYRPEDVQMAPDIVPLSPQTGLKLETDPMTQSSLNDVEDMTKKITGIENKLKHLTDTITLLSKWHSHIEKTETYEYKTTPFDDLIEGIEKGDIGKILNAQEALKNAIKLGEKKAI